MSNELITALQSAAGNVSGDFYPYTIDNSVRIQGTSSKYLSRSTALASSPTDAQKLSFSCWMKVNKIHQAGLGIFFNTMSSGYPTFAIYDYSNYSPYGEGSWEFQDYRPTPTPRYLMRADTISQQRDFSAWYHLYVVVDTTLSTGSDRYKLYLNGVPIPYTTTDQPAETPQNTDWHLFTTTNSAWGMYISPALANNSTYGHDFYLAEAHAVDGTAYDISKFGEFKNGVWIPVEPSGISYGNGGFYLDFADSSDLGKDVSGNGNHYTSTGLTSSDQLIDTPTNNFATLNPLASSARTTLSDGNLVSFGNNSAEDSLDYSTIAVTSGKWYWEEKINAISSAASYPCVGVARIIQQPSNGKYTGDSTGGGVGYFRNGAVYKEGSSVATYATFTTNDVIGVALDVDNLQISFYKNGTLQGTVTGLTSSIYYMSNANYYNSQTTTNFGQTPLTYTPPTDHLALSTANLPEPTIGPNIDDTAVAGLPEDQLNVLLYEGNSTNDRDITGVGFDPDLGIFKNRDENGYGWIIVDRNRGDGWSLGFDTGAQESGTGKFDSFITDGYRIDSHPGLNRSSIVNYSWKAGGTASSNTDGDITSNVSANTDAGFSIVTFTAPASGGFTVGHGLGATPAMVTVKITSSSGYSWYTWHQSFASTTTSYIALNSDMAASTGTYTMWPSGVSSTTASFNIGYSTLANSNNVAYIWAEKEGFSSFGSYTGNGDTSGNGPFIYTGFRPAFIMTKRTDASGYNWVLMDNARDTYNPAEEWLYPNSSSAEVGNSSTRVDFLSNGFKCIGESSTQNASGATYIYMAFAENPFKYSNAR